MHPFQRVYDKSNNERVVGYHEVLISVEEEGKKRKKRQVIRGKRGAAQGKKLNLSPTLCGGVHRRSRVSNNQC